MPPRPLQIALAVLLLPALLGGCDAIYDDTKGWANRLEASILKLGEEPQPSPGPSPDAAPGTAPGTPPALAAMPAPPAVPVEPVAVASLPESGAAPAARQPQPSPQTAETQVPDGMLADGVLA
ncbi:MAG TPA: hypothetical protein VKP12_03050, partial [Kiloniellaceae bacterium]|nr:hypothetical protein [Kiloniellaceae bacterium]